MNWLIEAAMRSRERDLLDAKPTEIPDDTGRRFRNRRLPPRSGRFAHGNRLAAKTRSVQLTLWLSVIP